MVDVANQQVSVRTSGTPGGGRETLRSILGAPWVDSGLDVLLPAYSTVLNYADGLDSSVACFAAIGATEEAAEEA